MKEDTKKSLSQYFELKSQKVVTSGITKEWVITCKVCKKQWSCPDKSMDVVGVVLTLLNHAYSHKDSLKGMKCRTRLREQVFEYILDAGKMVGTWEPKEVMFIFEEKLTDVEYDEVEKFLQWMFDNKKTMGSGNYKKMYEEFKKSEPVDYREVDWL